MLVGPEDPEDHEEEESHDLILSPDSEGVCAGDGDAAGVTEWREMASSATFFAQSGHIVSRFIFYHPCLL